MSSTRTALQDVRLGKLKSMNGWAAALHGAAALGFGIFFAMQDASKRTVHLTKTTVDPSVPLTGGNAIDFPPKAAELSGPPLDPAPLVVSFFGITAAFHAAYALDLGGLYSNFVIKQGINPMRWVEYGMTASLMTGILGAVDGTRDAVSLDSAILANVGMQASGFVAERSAQQAKLAAWAKDYNDGKATAADAPPLDGATALVSTLAGWTCFMIVWQTILRNFFNVTNDARAAGAPVPSWLGWLVGTQLLFFGSFGAVQASQLLQGHRAVADAKAGRPVKVDDFAAVEQRYIFLSFAAKLTLAAILAAGILERGNAS